MFGVGSSAVTGGKSSLVSTMIRRPPTCFPLPAFKPDMMLIWAAKLTGKGGEGGQKGSVD
jgi:hypothetical protein